MKRIKENFNRKKYHLPLWAFQDMATMMEIIEQVQEENELLKATSPLMCTMQLEKENERLKKDVMFWIQNSYKLSRKGESE